jgi:Kef-type K+ transport system membrane component KefB
VIAVVAVLAPLVVGFTGLWIPAIVLAILLGIVVGPQVFGWASNDEPVQALSVIGLAFLLLLAGLEIDFDPLGRGR